MKDDKFKKSIKNLEHALTFKNQVSKDPFYFFGISKSFEVCLEYAWKYLKRVLAEEGIEVLSPKEAIKHAGRLGFIEDVETWLKCLAERHLAVHDYLGVEDQDYLKNIEKFLRTVKKINK